MEQELAIKSLEPELLLKAKKMGFSDKYISILWNKEEEEIYCEKIDPITSKCIECPKGYYSTKEVYSGRIFFPE